jgi:glycosyltransferase involved in cell wall biosynthesis
MIRFLKIYCFLILLIGLFYDLKKKKIDISVIIPIFNSEKFLSKCLNSVINQSIKTIEIICIDDGSTDNSLQILKELNDFDKRIIIIYLN